MKCEKPPVNENMSTWAFFRIKMNWLGQLLGLFWLVGFKTGSDC